MTAFPATDLVSPGLAALKRRRKALTAPTAGQPLQVLPSSIQTQDVVRLTRRVAHGAAAGTLLPRPPAGLALGPRRRNLAKADAMAGARPHERRWRNASIVFVERRRGLRYQYGSIAVCAALWAQMFWMFRT